MPGHATPSVAARVVTWWLVHLFVAAAPLGLCLIEARPGRGFWVNFSVALGFVGLSVLGLQFALAARLRTVAAPFGVDVLIRYHRQMTMLAVLAAFGHPVILFAADDRYRPLLAFWSAPLRAQLAWGAVAALVLLAVTSLWRRALRLPYPAWHVLHSLLGIGCVLAALGHALLVDHYTAWMPLRLVWLAYGAAFCWLAVWVRLVKPLRMRRNRWRVVELHPEPGDSLTVAIEPPRRHANRFRFRAGQFAWIQTGRSVFSLTYHPFSMTSSAYDRDHVTFTIKRTGDFTSSVRSLRVGDEVFVDGPHGRFTLDRHASGTGFVFLATGVGVTPVLSMLATLADQGEQRPCFVFLGNRRENQIVGIRQLRQLESRLNLTVVHVISQPVGEWRGERGHITAAVLGRFLPDSYLACQFFLCSRADIVADLERTLRRALDVSANHIHSELFDMV